MNKPALFNKAKSLQALDSLIDRSLLPQGPVTNKVWDKEDEGSMLVFLTRDSKSPIGRLLDCIDEHPITVQGTKFASIASLWAFITYTTPEGASDDQLRSKYGVALMKYISDQRFQKRIKETADLNHQWSAIVAGIAAYITDNIENINTAITTHARDNKLSEDDVYDIEFVVPMSKSNLSRMYQEAINECWADIVDFIKASQVNEAKRRPTFTKRVKEGLKRFWKADGLEKARISCANAGVTEEWFSFQNFIKSVEGGKIEFHNNYSILSKLWGEGGATGLENLHQDFLLCAGLMKRHHPWLKYDFSAMENFPKQGEEDEATQAAEAEQTEGTEPEVSEQPTGNRKFSLADVSDLINSATYKDFIIGVHAGGGYDEDQQDVKLPEVSEQFTVRQWRTLRALVLFSLRSPRTHWYFAEDALELFNRVWYSEIMYFGASRTGYINVNVYGNRFIAFDEEVLEVGDILEMLSAEALKAPGSDSEEVKQRIADICTNRDAINAEKASSEVSDPVTFLTAIINSMIPLSLEKDLEYKPKQHFQKKDWNKSNNGKQHRRY